MKEKTTDIPEYRIDQITVGVLRRISFPEQFRSIQFYEQFMFQVVHSSINLYAELSHDRSFCSRHKSVI